MGDRLNVPKLVLGFWFSVVCCKVKIRTNGPSDVRRVCGKFCTLWFAMRCKFCLIWEQCIRECFAGWIRVSAAGWKPNPGISWWLYSLHTWLIYSLSVFCVSGSATCSDVKFQHFDGVYIDRRREKEQTYERMYLTSEMISIEIFKNTRKWERRNR